MLFIRCVAETGALGDHPRYQVHGQDLASAWEYVLQEEQRHRSTSSDWLVQISTSFRFHVYPRAFNTYVAGRDASPHDWHDQLANFNLVARVFIVNAIRHVAGVVAGEV